MKKNKSLVLVGALLLLAITITACKSTPPASKEPVSEPVQSVSSATPVLETKPVDDALTALRDRMENLRNECIKYKLDTYKAPEWAVAEVSRKTGLESYGVNYDLAKKSFEEAIAQYETIKKDSFSQIIVELDASLVSAREAAIAAGANEYYPEQFALADLASEETRTIREAGDLSASYNAGQKALMRYQFLVKGMSAVALKTKIDANQFEQYAPEDYALAHTKYDEAATSYGTADAAALESIVASVALYEKVNNAGFKVLTEPVVARVDEIRVLCDSIKAEKSMKTSYSAASTLYESASEAGKANAWESAYLAYSESVTAFSLVFEEATLKRNVADAAITAAKERQATGTALASKADVLAPLPEDAPGFSDETVITSETTTTEEVK